MGITELVREMRKLPDEDLLSLAGEIDEVVAEAVDRKLERAVAGGHFDDLAAEALREHGEGKTTALHEVLDNADLS